MSHPGESSPTASRSAQRRRWLSIAISALLLLAVYRSLDLGGVARALAASQPLLTAVGLFAIFPIKFVQGWRLRSLLPRARSAEHGERAATAGLPLLEAVRLILLADVLNLILPAKMGDIAKAWFLERRGHAGGADALALTVFEKAYDVLALLAWCALGFLALPWESTLRWGGAAACAALVVVGASALASERLAHLAFALARRCAPRGIRIRLEAKLARLESAWATLQRALAANRGWHARIALQSIGLWLLHFVQLWIFVGALGAAVPFFAHLALASIAILAGLAPFTFAGLGTRDAALVVLYRPYLAGEAAAALGLLFTSRYVLPAIAGAILSRTAGERFDSSPK